MQSVIGQFVKTLRENSFVLKRDFNELPHILPHKRAVFINSGIRVFLKKVLEDLSVFRINIQHYIDVNAAESMLGVIISIRVYWEKIDEYIVFDPIKGHIFHTDKTRVFFNDNLVSGIMKNINNFSVKSTNELFMHNIYPLNIILGAFKEVIISPSHIERNKYALKILEKIPSINLLKEKDDSINIHVIQKTSELSKVD